MRGFLSFSLISVIVLPGLALAAETATPAPGAKPAATAVELTEKQMVEQAEKALAVIEKVVGEVQAKLVAAREAKDTIRANCLGERLSQAKGLLKTCQGAASALNQAAAGKNADAARREFATVKAAQTKAGEVSAGAAECEGASATSGQGKAYGTQMTEPGLPPVPNRPEFVPPQGRPPKASPTE